MRRNWLAQHAAAFALAAAFSPCAAFAQQGPPESDDIVVTARRQAETLQSVPIPVSVIGGQLVEDSGSFNVNRLKELIPTVQFYSSNPRNSAVNIRGLGAPFGLTNDGIEPGVGFYVDGVFYARPAVATLDFLDVERIEVLRGPQGTLYGKNTTAGAINIVTRRPSFTPDAIVEASFGDYGYTQARGSITGPISDVLAGRLSFSATHRDGFLYNSATQDDLNDLDNLGFRGQLLWTPSVSFDVLLAADYTRQRPEGYAQVVAGVAPTLRAANRQYAAIAADLGYTPPSWNAFDRVTDADTPHRSYQDVGGVSLTLDWSVGPGALTSITAWRFWDWNPSNDRDFLGLPITTISANPSEQRQWSQEVRYAGDILQNLGLVVGFYAFHQTIDSNGLQEQGSAAARFLLAPSAAAATPGLLDGYGQTSQIASEHTSAALFGQLEWSLTERLRILPGLRFNYDRKEVDYDSQIYGGLATSDPALIALQRSILAPQSYAAEVDDTNISGQITIAYDVTERINAYATYATSFKSVGLNLGGLPNDATGAPVISAATVRPEEVSHIEIGVKTTPFPGARFNITAYQTTIEDYQAQVVNASVGVLRGYLANAEEVRVRGVEVDFSARLTDAFLLYGAAAYTDGIYVSFPDAPAPLEGTGGPQAVDISGARLPGVSEWAGSLGGEYAIPSLFLAREGEFFIALDASYRSEFSSSATPSNYLNVDGYALFNGRVGLRAGDDWVVFLWGRNLSDENYFEFLSAAPGGSGLFVGYPGDPRTWGITLRGRF
ncbi:MAG TPA: TonB-dependent receptor [Terricaulis sp.]|nr:TonB-dependent receptor [Terricaulis sp.]